MPLLLTCSLIFGSVSAVMADSTMQNQVSEAAAEMDTEEEQLETEAQGEHVTSLQQPAADQIAEDDAAELSSESDSEKQKNSGADEEKGSVPSASDKAEKLTEAEETEETEKTEVHEEEAAESSSSDIPYRELLSDIVVVTLEQNSSADAETAEAVEAVEDLSAPQMEALEVYIQDMGYPAEAEEILETVPDVQIKTITFNMNGFISLEAEGFGSGYDAMFYVDPADCQGNGNAYCIDPARQAPGHDSQGQSISYTTTVHNYRDPLLLKILYYGFGGPGDITGSHGSSAPARHILTHLAATKRAAELGIPGAGDYTYGANSTALQKADALYEAIRSMEDIQGTASVLTPVSGQQTILLLAEYSVRRIPRTTELTVKKQVTGSGGNKQTEFQFELQLQAEEGTELPVSVSCVRRENGEANSELTLEGSFSDSGRTAVYTFSLQHGQELTFLKLPAGAAYRLTEINGESLGYTVKAENAEGTLTEDPVETSFLNKREMIVPTGADPGLRASAGVVLLSLISGLLLLIRKRQG